MSEILNKYKLKYEKTGGRKPKVKFRKKGQKWTMNLKSWVHLKVKRIAELLDTLKADLYR